MERRVGVERLGTCEQGRERVENEERGGRREEGGVARGGASRVWRCV